MQLTAQSRSPFFWAALILTALALVLTAATGVAIWRHHDSMRDFGWTARAVTGEWLVDTVQARGPADGKLVPGDVITAWNGDTRIQITGPDLYLRSAADAPYRLRVRRGGSEHEAPLRAEMRPLAEYDRTRWMFLLEGAVFVLSGGFGALLRPQLTAARANFGVALGFSLDCLSGALRYRPEMLAGVPVGVNFDVWERALMLVLLLGFPLFLAFAYHFTFAFTGRPPGVWKKLVVPAYAACGLFYLAAEPVRWMELAGGETGIALFAAHPELWRTLIHAVPSAGMALVAVLGTLMIVVMIPGYRAQTSAGERRRMRLVVFAICASVTPITVLNFVSWLQAATGLPRVSAEALETADRFSTIFLTIIPLAIFHAIVRHRVFGVNVVIRRGLQYLLAHNVLRLLILLPGALLVLQLVSNPDRTLRDILLRDHGTWNLLLCGLGAAALAYRKPLGLWLDRRFFREAYDREAILTDLIEEVKPLDSVAEISRLTCSRIESALHPARVCVFYRESERSQLTVGYSSTGAELRVPGDSSLLAEMEGLKRSLEYPFTDSASLDTRDLEWLAAVGASLLIPMLNSGNRLVGILLLGEKKSEEPYTASDRQLLEAIGRQIGLLYENLQLREKVTRGQQIQRDVLAHLEGTSINLVKECPACGLCYDNPAERCERDGAELSLSLPVERVVEGKYRLDRLIGKGGMGAVYAAQDLRLNRVVAIKVMTGALFGNQPALRRFEVEARASARLNHVNITRIYDYGALGGGGAFLVMEYLDGAGWRDHLRRTPVFSPADAARRLGQLIDGIEAAHSAGVIHRDLKPENLVVCGGTPEEEVVKILDFGLAKLRQGELTETVSMTAPGAVIGTLGYMAPEQLLSGDIDERTDIFTLGVIAAECLTGRKPFKGRTYTELIGSVLNDRFTLGREGADAERLEGILQTALAKDRGDRFASAAAFRDALVPAIVACAPLDFGRRRTEEMDVAEETATRSIPPLE